MAARVHLVVSPSAAGNTARLVERWREATANLAPGEVLWLGPTRRVLDGLWSRVANGGRILLTRPPLTLQQFADAVVAANAAGARPLAQAQRRLLIEEILAELDRSGRLGSYRGLLDTRNFPDTIAAFLAEMGDDGITPTQLAAVLAGTREEPCAAVLGAYEEKLRRLDLYDEGGRVLRAVELLTQGHREPFAACRAVFVDGFADFTTSQRDLLKALSRWTEEVWIALPDEAADDRAEMFQRPRDVRRALCVMEPQLDAGIPESDSRPAGLRHLGQQLFRPRKLVVRGADADGLLCLEAPGAVGEARMVARVIRRLLDQGTPPEEIVVTLRELPPHADLVREVFAGYEIPTDIEGAEPLYRNQAVSTLLRALRLADDDWPFAGVTALLRSGYFRPDWPAVRADSDVVQHAEALLRLLGEPRGRDAYLRAVRHWAEKVHPGLEDEQALESRRQRTHELAVRCSGFLERFFHAWDELPVRAPLTQWVDWLRRFGDALGLRRAAAEDRGDAAALDGLEEELVHWAHLHQRLHGAARVVERAGFFRQLGALAAAAGVARTPRGPGRVRILSAELACGMEVDHLLILGLGERSFPRLAPPHGLLDEPQRQRLCEGGVHVTCAEDRLGVEMLLFYRLLTAARRQLVLSYAAVDDRGQALLPSSFLSAVHDCFLPGAVPRHCRRMLIEGYDQDEPLGQAEWRVQEALASRGRQPPVLAKMAANTPCSPDTLANLQGAHDLARHRFDADDFTPFDGRLRDPRIVADLHRRFGPDCILSPTALENYIACPFKFFLRHGLGLEPLEEPAEEIESTARGLAFHRALSRLHRHLRAAGVHQPDAAVEAALLDHLDQAFAEQASRASPAAEVLWNLEGQRLKRHGLLYPGHWQKFLAPWLEHGVRPRPEYFEVAFGLPPEEGEAPNPPLTIQLDDMEVRISGRIDRVDVAELPDGGLGFWVIDYKTGRSTHYTSAGLRSFEKLQLTLYALAAERVLLGKCRARPLGLAYWLVIDGGAKVALPGHPRKAVAWFDEDQAWTDIRAVLERWIVSLVAGIRRGDFALKPRSDQCTLTCDFGPICRISQSRSIVERKAWHLPLPTIG
jgi:ATP-dependent helicase/DNAse subunit B